ncbi:MAG TPA: Calx-beta domain-containing protein, partial [Verrucomicrobiota bacterium]|nr:Calx-beta domain-containing protein [Verrucomicrobiota bacterium]
HRDGPTNFPLYVSYSVSGTASNGLDYVKLSGEAVIQTGSRTTDIEIVPIYDNLIEGVETVIISVLPPICPAIYPPPPDCYIVGEPAEAIVKILDSQSTTNMPPEVAITSPQDGAIFTAPANIILNAKALDQDGYINTVEFWANDVKLCTITNIPESARPVSPFFFVWTNVPSGEYVLKAIAKDNEGACGVSLPVKIQVCEPTNQTPIVTIVATDSEASELPPIVDAFNPGIFTVRRTGPIDSPLTVYYSISGTASNGVDYKDLSGTVQIPAGKAYADIEVIPIDDNIAEGTETVIATLIVPQIIITIYPPPPPPYTVGKPNQATIYIYDNEICPTNIPPVVKITKPRDGMTFTAPADIGICAEAFDRDGKIAKIEFYEGTNKIGDALSPTNFNSALYPYYFMWKNVSVGDYVLTAIATDDCGQSAKSEPVKIKVIEPITNTIPIVNIEAIDALACEGPLTPIIIYTNYNNASSGGMQIITNRVPNINTATFLVKREGPTNSELSVHYAISGTASNGVDYLALPGVLVIPEGSRTANITIVPIDDKITEGPETVILTLVPSVSIATNEQPSDVADKPPYLIGPYGKASAVIVDNDLPINPTRLPDGQFHLYNPAPTNMVYILEVSADLIHWTPVITNTATEGFINYVDTDSPDYKRRFYRVLPVQQ